MPMVTLIWVVQKKFKFQVIGERWCNLKEATRASGCKIEARDALDGDQSSVECAHITSVLHASLIAH